MKIKFLFVLILFLLGTYPSVAQPMDNFTGSVTINDTIELGDTTSDIVAKFDAPNFTENVYWEMDEITVTYYHYTGAEFHFHEKKLISFKFTTATYSLNLGSFEIKVGNNISSFATPFPKSYTNRSSEGTSITLGPIDSVAYLSIATDLNGIITEIELRFI